MYNRAEVCDMIPAVVVFLDIVVNRDTCGPARAQCILNSFCSTDFKPFVGGIVLHVHNTYRISYRIQIMVTKSINISDLA